MLKPLFLCFALSFTLLSFALAPVWRKAVPRWGSHGHRRTGLYFLAVAPPVKCLFLSGSSKCPWLVWLGLLPITDQPQWLWLSTPSLSNHLWGWRVESTWTWTWMSGMELGMVFPQRTVRVLLLEERGFNSRKHKIWYLTSIYYDIVIYNNNNYIYSLHPHFWHSAPKNLWNFQDDEGNQNVFCYVNKVIFGDCLWMGVGCQEKQLGD